MIPPDPKAKSKKKVQLCIIQIFYFSEEKCTCWLSLELPFLHCPFDSFSFKTKSKNRNNWVILMMICDPLCNLLAFVQFKKRVKHPSWRSVKSNTPTWVLLSFLHCTNCTKSRRTSQMFVFTPVLEIMIQDWLLRNQWDQLVDFVTLLYHLI